jgi:hypothetical protein
VQTWIGESIHIIFDIGDLKISQKSRISLEGFKFGTEVRIIFLKVPEVILHGLKRYVCLGQL